MAGYVNAVSAFICLELPAREASSFCDFWKLTSCDFIAFISSMIDVNFSLFFMCLLRIDLPNLCPNIIIHVDALDFCGWHSKEVISFFWRSMYMKYAHSQSDGGISVALDAYWNFNNFSVGSLCSIRILIALIVCVIYSKHRLFSW